VAGLADSFGRGAMTQHWNDIANSDVIMICGANAAENHPISFKWVQAAMGNVNPFSGKPKTPATLIVVDPRHTRTATKASVVDGIQLHCKIRPGTDIAFFNGMMKWAIDEGRVNWQYLRDCTNASFLLEPGFQTCRQSNPRYGTDGVTDILEGNFTGIFSGLVNDPRRMKKYKYNKSLTGTNPGAWQYQYSLTPPAGTKQPLVDRNAGYWDTIPPTGTPNSNSVWAKFIEHLSAYTLSNVSAITGECTQVLQKVYEAFTETYADNKSANIMYAMGGTQHTYGSQNIRAYSIMQMLLGNIGVAGGGINAMRGESNVQGSTDMGLLWGNLPGYLAIPTNAAGYIDRVTYKATKVTAETPQDPTAGTGVNNPQSIAWQKFYPRYLDSLLQAWYPWQHLGATDANAGLNQAYQYIPKARADYWYTHT